MSRKAAFTTYRPKTILNKAKRADHWFWTRYSAYPYLGCQHGCEFCYCRERKYAPYDDPLDFAYQIKVKENAPELLRRSLIRAPRDAIFTGDYQPVERLYQLSRKMLGVCAELGFPVFVLERSPLVLRDLDILQSIQAKSAAVVAFSIITAPGSVNYHRVRQIEHLAPSPEKRFLAMEKFASAGILTGACMMPILPGLCEDDHNLENVVRWTADHGGQFVLVGGLTLADQQKAFFFNVLQERFPDLLMIYTERYPTGAYGQVGEHNLRIARRIRDFCLKHGIQDRMPRPVIPGEKRALNKRLVEQLANDTYTMELEGRPQKRIWDYRKAAWAVEDLEQDIGLFYQMMGIRGLESLPGVGQEMAPILENKLQRLRGDSPKNESPDL